MHNTNPGVCCRMPPADTVASSYRMTASSEEEERQGGGSWETEKARSAPKGNKSVTADFIKRLESDSLTPESLRILCLIHTHPHLPPQRAKASQPAPRACPLLRLSPGSANHRLTEPEYRPSAYGGVVVVLDQRRLQMRGRVRGGVPGVVCQKRRGRSRVGRAAALRWRPVAVTRGGAVEQHGSGPGLKRRQPSVTLHRAELR
ncbi:hypothetical protein INR49_005393 [Caranx melampygus]|nr:hypothetical protein INR49_005393 [Caranx melampygus]